MMRLLPRIIPGGKSVRSMKVYMKEGYGMIREWMIRCAAGLVALALTIIFFVSPMGEENTVFGSVNDGRAKYELEAGGSLTWEWTPEEDGITSVSLRPRGLNKAPDLILEVEITSLEGERAAFSRQAVSEMGEDGEWTTEGLFSKGTVYRLTVRASGSGSLRLSGTEEEDGFLPAMLWQKTTLTRYGMYLYVAAGFLLFALFPIPARKNGAGRIRKLLLTGGGLLLSVLWFMQTMGIPRAYHMDNPMILAWCLHYAAWFYLGVMGRLLFGSSLTFEKKSAVAILMLGVIFIFAMTPNSGPDEALHFNNSYGVSNYLLFQQEKSVGDARDYDLDTWTEQFNSAEGYEQVAKRLFEKRSEDESKVYWVPSSFTYALMYVPQAVGITIGRLFRANTLILYYLGRLFNLLFYAFCIFLAVRAVPRKKELFFGIGMLPMAVHQAASYSYDAFTNGMAILWTALVFRAVWEERSLGKKDYFGLILVGGLMAPSKAVYFILAGLLVLIPQKRVEHSKKAFSVGGMILAMFGIMAIFWLPYALGGFASHKGGTDVYTVQDILRQPFSVLRILFYSAEENLPEWLAEATGFVFSGYSLWIQVYIPVVYLILLAVLAQRKVSDPEPKNERWKRIVLLTLIAAGIVLIELVELMIWTPVGSSRVSGIQGRYFIPLIPLVFLALETGAIQRKGAQDDRKLVWALSLLHVLTVDHILIQTIRGV